jgi:methyltransferase (TIGR00027 family)
VIHADAHSSAAARADLRYEKAMKAGKASRTAELVCAGRAIANAWTEEPKLHDPTAFALLSERGRARVKQALSDVPPDGMRARAAWGYLRRQAKVMLTRTLAVDDAVREAASPQLVILGAGLDGRAWRMRELERVVVFEVDHPDSQRMKQARASALTRVAEDIRFVPVDFVKDSLDAALTTAGHDPARATTWLWEGVVMYLTPADVEATLAVIARRSSAKSRLVIVYHSPAFFLPLVSLFLRRYGEPFRSAFEPEAMRALLWKYDFSVVRDDSANAIGARLSAALGEATKYGKHLRVVTADRAR